jgi:hypothetical protein
MAGGDRAARVAPFAPTARTIHARSVLTTGLPSIEQLARRPLPVGVDDVQNWDEYDEVVATIRQGLLAALTRPVAEQVAWRNAARLFHLE